MRRPWAKGLAGAFALATLVCAVATTASPAGATGYSFRNSAAIPEAEDASIRLTFACLTSGPTTGTVSYATALARARALVKVGSKRYRKLDNLKAIDKPVKAQGAAAMAILKGSPKGALAALIAALEETPGDPVLLLDAGVLLVQLGKPREALAFIERAAKRPAPRTGTGVPWVAVLDANRAFTLVALKRYTPAAQAARRALQRAPWLMEAQESLAAALFCGGNPDQGVCELRAAQRRVLEEEDEALTCSAKIARDFRDGDYGDITPGPDGVLPNVPTPATVEVAGKYVDTYAAMTNQLVPRSAQRNARLTQLIPQQSTWAGKAQPASVQRTQDLATRWNAEHLTDEAMAAQAQISSLQSDVGAVLGDTTLKIVQFNADCALSSDFPACFRAKCNPMLKQNHQAWLNAWNALNTFVRDWWKGLHARLRGIQRGVEPAAYNEFLGVLTDDYGEGYYLGILMSNAGGWANVAKTWKEPCLDDLPDPVPPAPTISGTWATDRCPGALNNLKAELSLDTSLAFGGNGPIPKAGITVKCSSVEVSLSWSPLPLLTGYGKLNVGFGEKGTTTLTFGTKAGAAGVNFVSEVAITADSRGKVRDAAWNVGPKGPFGRQDIVSIPLVGSPVGPSL